MQEKAVEAMEDIFKEDDRASLHDDHGVLLRTTLSTKISMSALNYYPPQPTRLEVRDKREGTRCRPKGFQGKGGV
jgi:hypothetical protein